MTKKASVIIILGYSAKSNENILQKRLEKGLLVAKKYNVTRIIVSGKGNTDETESEYMAKWLKQHDFKGQVIQESSSNNTIENFAFTLKILKKINPNDVFIVTSHFHSKRVQTIAEQTMYHYKYSIELSEGSNAQLSKKENIFQTNLERDIKNGTFKKKFLKLLQ